MTKVNSKFKIFGGFGLLLLLNILVGFGSYKLLTSSKISFDKVDIINDNNALVGYSVIIGFNLLFLLLLTTQCKFIIVDNNGITFINPIIPILRRKKKWTDFDYFILVDEVSRYGTNEAVWLIKNERIKGRFSSFYYKNYEDIKNQIITKRKGKKNYGPFEQLFALIGLMKIKN